MRLSNKLLELWYAKVCFKFDIEEVLWSIRVIISYDWSRPLTNVKWLIEAWPDTMTLSTDVRPNHDRIL